MSKLSARTAAYAGACAVPWLVWMAGLYALRTAARSSQDVSAYTGFCVKHNGYKLSCTLDQWLLWNAEPWLSLATFVGAIAAAAVSGWVYLRYRRATR